MSYMGRHGGGAEYSYEITKGLLENHKEVYAIISAQVDNIDLWKALPLKRLILIPTSDQYKGFFTGTLRFIFKDIRRIRNLLKGVAIDILFIPMAHPWSTLTRMLLPCKHCVGTLHDPIIHPGTPKLIRLFLWIDSLRTFDSLVILSQTYFEYTKKKYKKEDREVVVIPHGAFSHYDMYSGGANSNPISKFNFLFFGRITEYKGIDLLVDAYSRLSSERDDVSLRIIGEGDMSPYQEKISGCRNCIVDNRYIGDDEVHNIFSMANTITVIPYTSATQSGVIPIAMREKSLIINTNITSLLEQTLNGSLSLCCDADAKSLCQQMLYAIEHYEECADITNKAKSYIESLSWDKLASLLLQHFKRMIGNEP